MVLQLTRKIKMYILHLLFFMIFSVFLSGVGHASGEWFFLTGIVKSIDYKSHQIVVDVKNKSCNGIKTFSFDDQNEKEIEIAAGDKIEFFVDSVNCPTTEIRRIVGTWRVRK